MGRESSLEERLRHDQEKAEAIHERQLRLGHIPAIPPLEQKDSEPLSEEEMKRQEEEQEMKRQEEMRRQEEEARAQTEANTQST